MSESRQNGEIVPATSIHSYALTLYGLKAELGQSEPDMQAVTEFIDSLRGLKGIPRFGVIGNEAEHCMEYLVGQKAGSGEGTELSLSETERKEVEKKVREWISNFEENLGSAVASAPTTEISANELLGGSHELLAEHVGERFEPEVRDLNEATINLCAGSYTSTEFMCIRAVERLLRKLFHDEMGDQPATKDWSRALETVAQNLEDRRSVPEELRTLEYLQTRRNELVRPDSHSSQEDAERTLMKTLRLVDGIIASME